MDLTPPRILILLGISLSVQVSPLGSHQRHQRGADQRRDAIGHNTSDRTTIVHVPDSRQQIRRHGLGQNGTRIIITERQHGEHERHQIITDSCRTPAALMSGTG
jgi:hypothetical protein